LAGEILAGEVGRMEWTENTTSQEGTVSISQVLDKTEVCWGNKIRGTGKAYKSREA